MTVTVHSNHKWVILSRDGVADYVHEVPRRNRFFKEELRKLREDVVTWLCGAACDELVVYKPVKLSFYRRVIYHAIVRSMHRKDRLVLIRTYVETSPVIR